MQVRQSACCMPLGDCQGAQQSPGALRQQRLEPDFAAHHALVASSTLRLGSDASGRRAWPTSMWADASSGGGLAGAAELPAAIAAGARAECASPVTSRRAAVRACRCCAADAARALSRRRRGRCLMRRAGQRSGRAAVGAPALDLRHLWGGLSKRSRVRRRGRWSSCGRDCWARVPLARGCGCPGGARPRLRLGWTGPATRRTQVAQDPVGPWGCASSAVGVLQTSD